MLEFEWDETKNIANQKKHGISFEDAEMVFDMPHYFAESNYVGEKRYVAIGVVKNSLVAVVFTYRNAIIRIISVRKARKNEKNNYQETFEGK
ncbi:MAG: BrnT family toxin [Rickettsiales bacterium]